MNKLHVLANRYISLIEDAGVSTPKRDIQGSFQYPHLLWMLYEIINCEDDMSLTKQHRWIGFIQGILVKDGLINVPTEREITRPILNGE